MPRIYVTMIRHGESMDNLTSVWAGHRDASLSNHGYNQSMRLGKHFEDVPITAIYASDLSRAFTTAKNVHKQNKTNPPPPLTVSPLLREQFFGLAEGEPWDAGRFSSTHLPWEDHRKFKLAPHAESLNDVGRRADWVLREFVLPHLLLAEQEGTEDQHVVLVAHGIWLSEMMFAFKRAEQPGVRFVKTSSYQNTAWSRLEIEVVSKGEEASTAGEAGGLEKPRVGEEIVTPAAPSEAAPSHADAHEDNSTVSTFTPDEETIPLPSEIAALRSTLPNVPPRHPSLPPPHPHSASANDAAVEPTFPIPRLKLKVLATNQAEHLEGLVRTKGGVGSSEWDEKQRGLKEFFAGGGSLHGEEEGGKL
ncbi:histidine phosphatase superfamily [Leucosporidium creatinivorum]|uniref:Histidine phosphatase superfamily n=1 Tax=Leucosporidium creatinivorum TaxID=106004 RepID=A0A1Y2FZ32_9BASI|nr:histidine phosphatase superfamily [Leucosporidium creatinivorum]